MKVSPARLAAFEILRRIETERAYSSALLPIFEAGLSEADRGLCHELVLGSLRRQIYLDRIIDMLSTSKKLDIEVRIAIRIGLYQLYSLDKIPHYSAINESVNLVQAARKRSAKGFVNAILRKAAGGPPTFSFRDEADRISVETSHPGWLIEKWIADLGTTETESLAAANNIAPETAFRLIGERSNETEEFVRSCKPSEVVDGAYIAEGRGRRLSSLAASGQIYVQDIASQMVASSVKIPKGGRFLDVCAAPGGKTGLIAARHGEPCTIFAGDLHDSRIRLLLSSFDHQRVPGIQLVQYDAAVGLPFAERALDSILVDAPCSGTGTIRRNPEIRYRLKPDDLPDLFRKQLAILTNASKLVKIGGTVTYSTCSIEPEENESVSTAFAAQNRDFELAAPDVPDRFRTLDGFARTWPSRDGIDGFFVAVFRRVS